MSFACLRKKKKKRNVKYRIRRRRSKNKHKMKFQIFDEFNCVICRMERIVAKENNKII